MNDWKNYLINESSKDNKLTVKQQNILIAAVELISENGYEKVSTSEIAKRAGVAEGTIFRQYKTKKDLLNAILVPSFMRFAAPIMVKSFKEEILEKEYIKFEDLIRSILEDRCRLAENETPLIRILVQEAFIQEDIKDELILIFKDEVFPVFEKSIKKFQQTNQIINIPAISILRIVVTNIFGYIVQRYVLFPNLIWDDDFEKEMIINTIIKSVTTNDSENKE